jgi:hypothetical protein
MDALGQLVVGMAVVVLVQFWLWLWLVGKVGRRQRRMEERLDALEKTANDQ